MQPISWCDYACRRNSVRDFRGVCRSMMEVPPPRIFVKRLLGTPEGRQQQRTVGQLPLFGRSKADCRPTEIAGKRLDIDGTWTVGEADRNVSGAVGNSDMERIIAYDGSSDRIICDFGIRQTTVNNRPPHQKLFAAGSRLQRRSQPKIPFGNQPQQPFPGQNLFDTKDIIHADGL